MFLLAPNPRHLIGRDFKSLIRDAGLLSALKICYDAGDESSFLGTGQALNDVSGNGYHMTLGATSSASTDDPTWSGVRNRQSAAEQFTYDGGDLFQLTSASNDTFLESLHKTGADWTVAAILKHVTSGTNIAFSTAATNAATGIGVAVYLSTSTNSVNMYINYGSGSITWPGSVTATSGQANMIAAGCQLISNTNKNFINFINGTALTTNLATNVTMSSSAGSRARIGANGNSSNISANNSGMYAVAVFNRMLNTTELGTLRTSCLRRWSTI